VRRTQLSAEAVRLKPRCHNHISKTVTDTCILTRSVHKFGAD